MGARTCVAGFVVPFAQTCPKGLDASGPNAHRYSWGTTRLVSDDWRWVCITSGATANWLGFLLQTWAHLPKPVWLGWVLSCLVLKPSWLWGQHLCLSISREKWGLVSTAGRPTCNAPSPPPVRISVF